MAPEDVPDARMAWVPEMSSGAVTRRFATRCSHNNVGIHDQLRWEIALAKSQLSRVSQVMSVTHRRTHPTLSPLYSFTERIDSVACESASPQL